MNPIRILRSIIATATSLVVIFTTFGGAVALEMEPEGKYNPRYWAPSPEGKERYTAFESMSEFLIGSQLGPALEPEPCSGAYPDNCTMDDYPNLSGTYVLDGCDDSRDPVCIEELTALSPEGAKIDGSLEFYYANPWPNHPAAARPGDSSLGIPDGEMMSVWRFPGLIHSGGSDRYILKFALGWTGCQKEEWDFCEFGKPMFDFLHFNLIPYSLHKFESVQDGGLMPPNSQTGDGRAGIIESFPEGSQITVQLRAPSNLSRWIRVRAEDVSVETEELSEQTTRISLQGKPALVPGLTVVTDPITDPWGNVMRQRAFGPGEIWVADELRDAAGDKATGEIRIFTFKTMDSPGYDYGCMAEADGFGGFVASNAMFYAPNAPEFIDGYLTYEIAGMHYNSDDTLARGNYEMVVNKDFASCLYGVEDISPSATIRVLNEQGEQEVAVSTVRENGNWIELSASNFTFSKKEIRVDLNPSLTWTAYQKTLATYSGNNTGLSSQQKSQIRSTLDKTPKAEKFICTGIRYYDQPMSVNIMVRKRAKEACEYAKQLNPTLSTWYQNKPTKARSYAGKVLLTVKSPG